MKESKVTGGRTAVYIPDHPAANNRGYILKSRYIMEQKLGRYLESWENVHHINGDKTDFHKNNLIYLRKEDHKDLERYTRYIKNMNIAYSIIVGISMIFFVSAAVFNSIWIPNKFWYSFYFLLGSIFLLIASLLCYPQAYQT